jgi:carboxymethylenebutenolidase
VEVEGDELPIAVLGPANPSQVPGLVVVPSIFGPAPDLLKQLSELSRGALVVVMDPFCRQGGGVIPYEDHDGAIGRLAGFDLERCFTDVRGVIQWTRENCNGRVVGLGICFGGPFVTTAAGEANLDGMVTWHGSRMENFLSGASGIVCPLRFHFGAADPITPPEAITAIREAFADHPDATIVVHPDLEHGFSHEGRTHDPTAAKAGVEATRALLESLL